MQFCGLQHTDMVFRVRVVSQGEYQSWLAAAAGRRRGRPAREPKERRARWRPPSFPCRRPEAHHEQPGGIVDYLTTVDHKKIGILYMVTAFGIFLAGGVLALLVRWELAQPGLQAMGENTYNQVFTMHGTLMIFLFAAQVSTGLANYLVLQSSAPPTSPSHGPTPCRTGCTCSAA